MLKHTGKHPELRDGEVFLTNATVADIAEICRKTKRVGSVAYMTNGTRINVECGLYPVFVQRSELDAAGISCASEHRVF
jgi:hypothetical protein